MRFAVKGIIRGEDARRLTDVQSGNVLMAGHLFRRFDTPEDFCRAELRRNGGDGLEACRATIAAVARGAFDGKPISPELLAAVVAVRRHDSTPPLSEVSVPQL